MTPTIPTSPLGRLRTKRIRAPNRTAVVLTFEDRDTVALRAACASLRPEDGREPSLSLVARRALGVYRDYLARVKLAGRLKEEIAELKTMTAPPSEATKKKLQALRTNSPFAARMCDTTIDRHFAQDADGLVFCPPKVTA